MKHIASPFNDIQLSRGDYPTEGTYWVMLGTGTPRNEWDRAGCSAALIVNGKAILIDAGPGGLRRIAAASEQGLPGLAFDQLDTLLLSHLHSDHTLGLSELIFAPWVLNRERALTLHGPEGTLAMCDHLYKAYAEDTRERLNGLEAANASGHQTNITEFSHEEQSLTIGETLITVFPVKHGSWPAFGFRFETPHATIVFSGDTAPFPNWETYYANADLLVHEVYSSEGLKSRNKEWHAYFETVHTSDHELGIIAAQAKPKALALFHQLYWSAAPESLVTTIKQSYEGPVTDCRDLETFYFPAPSK